MSLKGKRIGFGLTGSHCTYEEVFPQIEALISQGAEVLGRDVNRSIDRYPLWGGEIGSEKLKKQQALRRLIPS